MNELDRAYNKYVKKENSIKSTRTLNSTEDNCIIDSITRQIAIPESLKIAGVMADNNTKRIFFKCNKTAQITDLSKLNVCINYLNANNEADRYHCTDVEVINEYLTFSWLISNFATKYKGNITFVVCMYSDDMEEHWNSTLATLRVLEGLETTETVIEQNPDIFEEILSKMENIKETGKQIEAHVAKAKEYADNAKQSADSAEELEINVKQYVIDAEQSAVKAKEEADKAVSANSEKLDKNQGTENEGKTIIVDKDGNLIPGEALPKNIYTKEEVDYILADKMDKPYQSISISENITLNDCLEGNFKIDSIEGNCYHDSLENITPSPEQNIPVISKKINITVPPENAFDLQTESNTDLIPEEGTYKSIAIHKLKPNTEYKIGFESVNVPAKTNLTLRVKNNSGTIICNIYTFFNMGSTAKIEQGVESTFTTDSTGNVSFEYNCMVNLSNTIETYREYWYTKITNGIYLYENKQNIKAVELRSLKESSNIFDSKFNGFMYGLLDMYGNLNTANKNYASTDFISVRPNTQYFSDIFGTNIISSGIFFFDKNKEIVSKTDTRPFVTPSGCYYVRCGITIDGSTLLEDLSIANNAFVFCKGGAVNAYIPQTVRDYKIVDHTNKRSYIERNVGTITAYNPTKYNEGFYFYNSSMKNLNNYKYAFINCLQIGTVNQKNCAIVGMNSKYVYCFPDWCNQGMTIDEIKTNLAEKPILLYYPLETPVTEEIEYIQSNTSEFGVSSQDSTSPSPNIKSPIEKVEVLNIKACAKNMFNPQNLSGGEIMKFNGVDCYKYIDKTNNFIFDFSHNNIARQFTFTTRIFREDGNTNMTNMHFRYNDGTKTTMQIQNVGQVYTFTSDPNKILKQIEGNYSYAKVCYIDLSVTQLEVNDTATAYEPYQENGFSYELENPLKKVGDKSDTIDLANLTRKNNIYKEDLTTLTVSSVDNAGGYNHTNTTNRFYNLNVRPNAKSSPPSENVKSNILPYAQAIWNYDKTGITINYQQVHISLPNLLIGINNGDSSAERTKKLDAYIKSLKGTGNEYIYYAVEEPSIEPLESSLVEKIKQLKTYGSVTHVIITGKVKPTVNAKYPQDVAITTKNLKEEIAKLTETTVALNNQLLVTQSAVIENDVNNLIGDIKDE